MKEQEEVDRIIETAVLYFYEEITDFGKTLAGDDKYIDSVAKHESKIDEKDNRSEVDAKWSLKEYHYVDSKGKKEIKKEHHFGFKAHIICDVETELPIVYSVTAANADEKNEMLNY